MALAAAALTAPASADFTLDLGHAAVARARARPRPRRSDGGAAPGDRAQGRATRWRAGGAGARLAVGASKLLAALPSLYGGPEVIERARALVEGRGARRLAVDG